MASVHALVLRAPGTNCDQETIHALKLAGAETEAIHLGRIVEQPSILDPFQILCIPGGFSYGDDVAAGRIFATLLTTRLGDALRRFRDQGKILLGICNGFQVLLQTGLLLEKDESLGRPPATLALNRHGRFEDRWIHLRMTPGRCVIVRDDEILEMPIAHAEGNFHTLSALLVDRLASEGRVIARYVDAHGQPGDFPINPNGSMGDVAGICDSTGRVAALMPHPERHVSPFQHPRWTRRRQQPAEGDGLRLFRNLVRYFD